MAKQFELHELDIPGAFLIEPFCAEDARGSVVKDYSKEVFLNNGIAFEPAETLYITSKKRVLRGLHFQRVKPQAKLLRCVSGRIQAVVVDLREGSRTLGRYVSAELSGDNIQELFIPEGCALGTLAFEDSLMACRCGDRFYPEYDDGIRWDDETVGVQWSLSRLDGDPIISDKDKKLGSFAGIQTA